MTKSIKTQFIFLWLICFISIWTTPIALFSFILSILVFFQVWWKNKPEKLPILFKVLYIILIILSFFSILSKICGFICLILSICIYMKSPRVPCKYSLKYKIFIVCVCIIICIFGIILYLTPQPTIQQIKQEEKIKTEQIAKEKQVQIDEANSAKQKKIKEQQQEKLLQEIKQQDATKKLVEQKKQQEKEIDQSVQVESPKQHSKEHIQTLTQEQDEQKQKQQVLVQHNLQQKEEGQNKQQTQQQTLKSNIQTPANHQNTQSNSSIGIIDHYADIHSQPNSHSSKEGTLQYGETVTIISKSKDYYYITSNNGTGYVYENFIRK